MKRPNIIKLSLLLISLFVTLPSFGWTFYVFNYIGDVNDSDLRFDIFKSGSTSNYFSIYKSDLKLLDENLICYKDNSFVPGKINATYTEYMIQFKGEVTYTPGFVHHFNTVLETDWYIAETSDPDDGIKMEQQLSDPSIWIGKIVPKTSSQSYFLTFKYKTFEYPKYGPYDGDYLYAAEGEELSESNPKIELVSKYVEGNGHDISASGLKPGKTYKFIWDAFNETLSIEFEEDEDMVIPEQLYINSSDPNATPSKMEKTADGIFVYNDFTVTNSSPLYFLNNENPNVADAFFGNSENISITDFPSSSPVSKGNSPQGGYILPEGHYDVTVDLNNKTVEFSANKELTFAFTLPSGWKGTVKDNYQFEGAYRTANKVNVTVSNIDDNDLEEILPKLSLTSENQDVEINGNTITFSKKGNFEIFASLPSNMPKYHASASILEANISALEIEFSNYNPISLYFPADQSKPLKLQGVFSAENLQLEDIEYCLMPTFKPIEDQGVGVSRLTAEQYEELHSILSEGLLKPDGYYEEPSVFLDFNHQVFDFVLESVSCSGAYELVLTPKNENITFPTQEIPVNIYPNVFNHYGSVGEGDETIVRFVSLNGIPAEESDGSAPTDFMINYPVLTQGDDKVLWKEETLASSVLTTPGLYLTSDDDKIYLRTYFESYSRYNEKRRIDIPSSDFKEYVNQINMSDLGHGDGYTNATIHFLVSKNGVQTPMLIANNNESDQRLYINVNENASIPTAVTSISTDNEAKTRYFNLQGIEIENPTKGIFIKVCGNTATKVIIR